MRSETKAVLFLLDGSGSMADYGRIHQLNQGVRTLLDAMAGYSGKFLTAAVVFQGDSAFVQLPFTPAELVQWENVIPRGESPFASALELAAELIAQVELPPTLVLISDGLPESHYEETLRQFVSEGQTSACERFVLCVTNAAEQTMQAFASDPEIHMLNAEDTDDILKMMQI